VREKITTYCYKLDQKPNKFCWNKSKIGQVLSKKDFSLLFIMSYCQKSLKVTKIQSIWKCLPSSPKSEREFSGDKLFCTNHVLLFEKKTHKKEITFGILVTNLKVPKFFSLQSFEKGRKFQYPRFFFLQDSFSENLERSRKAIHNYFFHTCIIYVCSMQRKNLSI